MSAITKEQLIESLQHKIYVASVFPESEKAQIDLEIARIALASLEAEAVATFYKSESGNVFNTLDSWLPVEVVNKLYAEPQLPQPAVPAEMPEPDTARMFFTDAVVAIAKVQGWNACRAAMLQDSEPATDNTNQQFESLSRGDK